MRRLAAGIAALAIAAGGGSGAAIVASGSGSCGYTVCVAGATGSAFQNAYLAASPGDVVTLEPGLYPAQQMVADPSKAAATEPVTFEGPATLARKTGDAWALWLGSTDYTKTLGPRQLLFRDIRFGEPLARVFAYPGTEDVTFDRVAMGEHNFTAVKRVKLLNSDIGPWNGGVSFVKNAAGQPLSQDVEIRGNRYHDVTITDPADHSECFYAWGTRNLDVEGNVFQNCTDIGLFAAGSNAGLRIVNNFFDAPMPGNEDTRACDPACPRGGYSVQFKSDPVDPWPAYVAYNSMLGAISTGTTAITTRKANVACGSFSGCPASQFAATFVDPVTQDGTMDLHLVAGAAAIDTGDQSDFPATDIDGQARADGKPDQGADEFGSSPVPPPTTTTTTSTTTTTEPPPMTTYADDFERATLGPNWTVESSGGASAGIGIVNDSDLGLISTNFGLATYKAAFTADQFSEAEISSDSDPALDKGVYVRRRASDGARYQFHYDSNGTDSDPRPQWQIKYDGVPTAQVRILATNFVTPAPVAGDVLRIEAQGPELRGYVNGQLVLSATDSTLTSGAAGVALLNVRSVALPAPIFERWAGGDLVAPPPPDSLPLSIIAQDATTVTVAWTPVSGIGYRFSVDGKIVSHTWDPTRASVKFARKAGAVLGVEAMKPGESGSIASP